MRLRPAAQTAARWNHCGRARAAPARPIGQFISDGYRYSSKYNLDSMSSRQWLTYFVWPPSESVWSRTKSEHIEDRRLRGRWRELEHLMAIKLSPLARRAILSEQFMRGVMVSLVVFNTPYIVLMDSIRVIDILLNAVAALLLLDLDEVWCFLLLPEYGPQVGRADACEQACGVCACAQREGGGGRDDAFIIDQCVWLER